MKRISAAICVAFGCVAPAADWFIDAPPGVEETVVRVQIREDGCRGRIVYEQVVHGRGGPALAAFPDGRYGFGAMLIARSSCEVVATGCVEASLPRDAAIVTATRACAGTAECACVDCPDFCEQLDASVDAEPVDVAFDADLPDGGCVCALPNALTSCSEDICTLELCEPGFKDCDDLQATGCEVDVRASPLHCGACGASCGLGQCVNGTCDAGPCPTGLDDCDDDPTNGCETALGTSDDCASCGDACSVAGGTGACVGGSCEIAACSAGQADCNGAFGDGCEVSLRHPTPACTGFVTVGPLCGDTGSSARTAVGHGEAFYRIFIDECSGYSADLSVRFGLTVPAGVDYDLHVDCDGCIGASASSTRRGMGADELVDVGWPDEDDADSKFIHVRVEHVSGDSCADWALTTESNYYDGNPPSTVQAICDS